jgi:hypothetical protein
MIASWLDERALHANLGLIFWLEKLYHNFAELDIATNSIDVTVNTIR